MKKKKKLFLAIFIKLKAFLMRDLDQIRGREKGFTIIMMPENLFQVWAFSEKKT